MVVADNRAYDYRREQYLENLELEKQLSVPKPKTKKKAKPKLHIFSIAFVFCLSILVISRYGCMAEINYKNSSMQKKYNEIVKENSDLNGQLMRAINLEQLEKAAVEKLQMQYPDTNQVVYLSVEYIETQNSNMHSKYHDVSDVNENKYITYAKNVINNMVKILD